MTARTPDTDGPEFARARQAGDRRHLATSELVSIAMLVLQFGALVWGASALKSSVDELRVTMVEMTHQIRDTQGTVNGLSIDVGILKDRSKLTAGPQR